MLLVVETELTLIDTGFRGSSEQIEDCIRQLGRSPREISRIILTHNHVDHVGGMAELKQLTGARVAMHKTDIGERKNLPSARAGDIDIQLEGGEVFDVLGGLEIIHTPGHTPGSICLFSARHKMLIVGDAVRKRRDNLLLPFRTASYDQSQAIKSVMKLALLDFDILCFGHGLPLTEGARVKMQDLADRHRD